MSSASQLKLKDSLKTYAKYKRLYRSLKRSGAHKIAQDFFQIPSRLALPLSLAHGVHPLGEGSEQDCHLIEPIHWAFNDSIYDNVQHIKPAVKLPHPWLLLEAFSAKPDVGNNLNLLLGPPPSYTNDTLLWDYIFKNRIKVDAVLVKPRGPYFQRSIDFWKSKGIEAIHASSYSILLQILTNCETVYCPYLSSAIFLAASAGCDVQLLPDYSFLGYDEDLEMHCQADELVDFRAPWIDIVKACFEGNLQAISLKILGYNFLASREELSGRLAASLESNQSRIYTTRKIGSPRLLLYDTLLMAGLAWPNLYQLGITKSITKKLLPDKASTLASLELIKYPSINDYCQGVSNEIIVTNVSRRFHRAGWGADHPCHN